MFKKLILLNLLGLFTSTVFMGTAQASSSLGCLFSFLVLKTGETLDYVRITDSIVTNGHSMDPICDRFIGKTALPEFKNRVDWDLEAGLHYQASYQYAAGRGGLISAIWKIDGPLKREILARRNCRESDDENLSINISQFLLVEGKLGMSYYADNKHTESHYYSPSQIEIDFGNGTETTIFRADNNFKRVQLTLDHWTNSGRFHVSSHHRTRPYKVQCTDFAREEDISPFVGKKFIRSYTAHDKKGVLREHSDTIEFLPRQEMNVEFSVGRRIKEVGNYVIEVSYDKWSRKTPLAESEGYIVLATGEKLRFSLSENADVLLIDHDRGADVPYYLLDEKLDE